MKFLINLFVLVISLVGGQAYALSCAEICNQVDRNVGANKSEIASLAIRQVIPYLGGSVTSPHETIRYTAWGGYYLAASIAGADREPMKLGDLCPSVRLGATSDTPFRIAALGFATKKLADKNALWTCR